MSKIHVLSSDISNKIAAGEVVERPASVVKELVENSIDAGATKIVVEIKNGGISLISVEDNGSGMAPDDAQIAFLRHATSKIQKEEDLDAIFTLGFRGEALSSIGAVSEAVIYTKRQCDEYGTVVSCEGGEIIASDEGGMSDGTKVVVRNLFFNTPARMKFLKKDATEAGYISDIINRFVLAHPEISFRFIKNGKDVVLSTGDGNIRNAVYSVYGRDYANNLIDVEYEMDGVKVSGVIGKSNLSRPNRNFQSFYVNKRCIKSPLMIRALEEAYKNQIMIGKFPVAILNVEVNPINIDINVHPTKLEVKFSDEKKIYDTVYYGVKSALFAIPETKKEKAEIVHNPRVNPFLMNKSVEVKTESAPTPVVKETPFISVQAKEDPLAMYRKKEDTKKPVAFASPEVEIKVVKEPVPEKAQIQLELDTPEVSATEKNDDVSFKVCGQVFDTYIIVQRGNEMLLIDQHAAHERIKYEQLLKSLETKEVYPQILLEPVVIRLGGAEFSAFEAEGDVFNKLGFDAEIFGESEVIVRAAPQEIDTGDVEDLFLELLSECILSKKEIISAKLQRLTYTIACKAAIKANHILSTREMEGLVKSVMALDNINTCPHGRPITIVMTKKELEKKFKRIV